MANIRKLSPSELSGMMDKMNPISATRFYNKCMTNPDTPDANISLLKQYRAQNPEKFASMEQMGGNRRYQGSWLASNGGMGRRWFREDRIVDSDGYSYDNFGNRFDNRGNMTGGYHDGGSEPFQGNGNPNGFSNYYGAAYQRPRQGFFRRNQRKPIGEARSYEELGSRLMSFDSDIARTRYFLKVSKNPETNPETLNNLVRFRNNNPQLFASDDDAIANGPTMQPRKGGWGNHWKSKEQFDSMTPKKQKFFVRAFQGRNRARNTAYGLRVMTNPVTSSEDKQAMSEVVNENPGLFFKQTSDYNGYQNGQRQG